MVKKQTSRILPRVLQRIDVRGSRRRSKKEIQEKAKVISIANIHSSAIVSECRLVVGTLLAGSGRRRLAQIRYRLTTRRTSREAQTGGPVTSELGLRPSPWRRKAWLGAPKRPKGPQFPSADSSHGRAVGEKSAALCAGLNGPPRATAGHSMMVGLAYPSEEQRYRSEWSRCAETVQSNGGI